MLNLKRLFKDYHNTARTLAEVLPWMVQVTPGLVLNKDGSLLACYTYSGVDQEGLLIQDVDHYAQLVEHAMRTFDDRITLWWTADRRKTTDYPESNFPDPISAMIDDLRRTEFKSGSHYKNTYSLSVLFRPPGGSERFFDRIAFFSKNGMSLVRAFIRAVKAHFDKKNAFAHVTAELDGMIETFEEMLMNFVGTISEVKPHRLEGPELLAFLHDRANPLTAGQPINTPRFPVYLDAFLGDSTLYVGPNYLKFEDHRSIYAAAVSVKDWPEMTYPGVLDVLMTAPGELTLSQCFRFLDLDDAKKFAADMQRFHLNLRVSLFGQVKEALFKEPARTIDEGREIAAQDATTALSEMTAGNRIFGYYNFTAVTYGDTQEEAEETLKAVSQGMRKSGFLVVRETLHLLSAWAGTVPGQWGELVRWYFVSAPNLADLAPVRTLAVGETENTYLTEQTGRHCPALTVLSTEFHTPFYFNFHNGDMAHTMVIGPSRSGKSVFDNFLISQYRKYYPVNIFIFDKDYSCKIPTLMQDGQHIDLTAEGSKVKLNPMLLLGDRNAWEWLAKWLEVLLTSRGYQLTAEDDETLWRAIENAAALPQSRWRLLSLLPFLGKTLGEQLQQWVGTGSLAKYFDNEEDSFSLSEFTCVEMGGLFLTPRVASAFLEYAFYRINRLLTGKPTLIYIEEAWFMIADDYFCARINDWLRTLQKRNTFLIMATQSLDEIMTSDIFATIIDNIPNKIFLPNPSAEAHREMYVRKFSLNDEQVDRIRHALRKQQYYIVTPALSRMVNVHMPPPILACLRSDTRAQQVFMKHYRDNAPSQQWKFDYIDEMIKE